MFQNRDLAAAFGVLIVAWSALGAMSGFAAHYLPDYLQFPAWILFVAVLVFIPLLRGEARWTALGAGIVGIIGIIWDLVILTIIIARTQEFVLSAAFGPGIGLVLAVLFSFFAFRSYVEKTST